MSALAEVFAAEDHPPTLAAQVLAHRTAAHLSQVALAARAHVRQATVATIETGANTDAATLAKLADALGVALVVHPGATPPVSRPKR